MWIYTSCYVCGRSNRVAEISFSASPNIPSSWAPDPCGAPENLEFLHSSSPPPSPWAPESCYADGPACSLSFFPFCCSSPLSFLFLTSRPYSLSPLLCVWEKFTEWPNFVSVFPTVSPPPPIQCHSFKGKPCHVPSRSQFSLVLHFGTGVETQFGLFFWLPASFWDCCDYSCFTSLYFIYLFIFAPVLLASPFLRMSYTHTLSISAGG